METTVWSAEETETETDTTRTLSRVKTAATLSSYRQKLWNVNVNRVLDLHSDRTVLRMSPVEAIVLF